MFRVALQLAGLSLSLNMAAFATSPTLAAVERPRLAKMSPTERQEELAKNRLFLLSKRGSGITLNDEDSIRAALWFVSELSADAGDARLCVLFTNTKEGRIAITASEAFIRIEHRRVGAGGGAFNMPNSVLQVWTRPFGGYIGDVLRELKPPGAATILRNWYAEIQPVVLNAAPLIHVDNQTDLSSWVHRACDILETIGVCGGAGDRQFAGEQGSRLLEAFAREERVKPLLRKRYPGLAQMIAEAGESRQNR